MSDNFKVKLNSDGIKALLQSSEVIDVLTNEAEGIASRAGNCEVEQKVFKRRARARVIQHMTKDDMENNTLLKAVH